ncbi:CheY-like receiver, AAA-type ATPase and DNA-binding domain-containing response regulator [Desulfocapsa sulfexigens DSM 10523]|uniref:CheY-like receiver, AAA-type ATPase and DNA-binding domain-containing response regulator n=1 Tax=Desulfocapsa sulfexigens (strain DSM 10523 / SB164P1) TaxID=1167006 RepID=M1NH21_DESSD|nr:sigma-54 dependent transcriptional regulator [Desulfocapsa sulfexigens]AGF78914.1 CheY-like receiver, AAA-type ATPase and DNA-binding domain-containing response regulator [Desulfocapsa sulfexigens DSM 10523]
MTDTNNKRLLIVDDEENMRHMLSVVTAKAGYQVTMAENGEQALAIQKKAPFPLILCDLKMPRMDGLQFLQAVAEDGNQPIIIMMSAYATIDDAVEAMKTGAYDFITKPFKTAEILLVLEKAVDHLELREENVRLKAKVLELQGTEGFEDIIAHSEKMQSLLQLTEKVARYDTTVLITGESGTGKELIAKGIHQKSERKEKPFIAVNCGSLPENLLESEFFGYVKGAFTGADKDHKGLFEEADTGTLFLDEVGELPLSLQVKLLRVLQEQEIRPVGGVKTKAVDVRVITATAKDMEREVEDGRFREDLFYRLNVLTLQLPPLRERKEDIQYLCTHFLAILNEKMHLAIEDISPEAMGILLDREWKGNIRELKNCLERAAIVAETNHILPVDLIGSRDNSSCDGKINEILGTFSLKQAKIIIEKKLISRALEASKGNKSMAARMLEISYPSLLAKIKEYL